MEHENKEKQTPIEFRCRKIIPGTGKSINVSPAAVKNVEAVMDEGSRNSIASPTPEKSDRKLSCKGKQLHDNSQDILSETLVSEITSKSIELPEQLKALADLFDRMCSSVRLLNLRKRLPTFQNICTQVEILSKRKFSYVHLAQMKYVFPDAIQIEKVLIHDERTLCMKPDLKVSILFDIMGRTAYPGQSISMALCHAFRVRLLEQLNTNRDVEIPEAVLPEPFNRKNNIKQLESLPDKSFSELPQQVSLELNSCSNVSHFSSSFRKHFCQKVIIPEAERTKILADDDVVKPSKNFDLTDLKDGKTSLPAIVSPSEAIGIRSFDNLLDRTPVKGASTLHDNVPELIDTPSTCIAPQSCQNTPANVDQIADDAISDTPAMQTPERPLPSPIEILVSTTEKSVNEPKSTPSVRRTLIYSPQKMDKSISKLDFDTKDLTKVHEHFSNESMSGKSCIFEQETNLDYDATTRINVAQKLTQPNSEKRKAILDCLPAMFDTIHLICQSTDCSLITKQQLMHKIISNNLDIEDTSEVEEQLGLLEQLVPEWLCKKSTCNGEFLYCIKRLPDPDSVRTRLSETV